ncbi:MAG: CoA-binding protein [Endomicrobiia bacterium]
MESLIKEFLSQKKIAVVGSFRNESKFAYKILRFLKNKGYDVYPVNPKLSEVDGIKCYPSVIDIPLVVDLVDLVTPPKVTEEIVKQCLQKGIKRIWLQPGAESDKAIKFCQENNIKVVYNACIMYGR